MFDQSDTSDTLAKICSNGIHTLNLTYISSAAPLRKMTDKDLQYFDFVPRCDCTRSSLECPAHYIVLLLLSLYTLQWSNTRCELITMFVRLSLPICAPSISQEWSSETNCSQTNCRFAKN